MLYCIYEKSQRGKRKDERSTDDGMAWNGFECKWLECGTTNCKMWISMMVADEVDMKCGMCIVNEMNVVKGEKDLLRKEVFERLEKVESDMIVKKSVIRKEVNRTNEEETRKKIIMIFNLKNKTGKSDVECVKDVFGKMGAGQSCDDVVDVVQLRQKENGPIIRPIIVEFRSEYDKWTVMRMKAKLRECEEYRSVFRDGSVEGRERGKETKVMKLKEERIQKERQ